MLWLIAHFTYSQQLISTVIEAHPHYYDVIIDKAMERLAATKNENKSVEARTKPKPWPSISSRT